MFKIIQIKWPQKIEGLDCIILRVIYIFILKVSKFVQINHQSKIQTNSTSVPTMLVKCNISPFSYFYPNIPLRLYILCTIPSFISPTQIFPLRPRFLCFFRPNSLTKIHFTHHESLIYYQSYCILSNNISSRLNNLEFSESLITIRGFMCLYQLNQYGLYRLVLT